MAKKNYNHGMNNFKIEQFEPRQMFSADVGLNDIEQQLEKKGFPPSVREICEAVGLSSTATIRLYIQVSQERQPVISIRTETLQAFTRLKQFRAVRL